MSRIRTLLSSLPTNLFVGPFPEPHRYVRPAVQNQWENIKKIWNNESSATFGIERIFRLLLALMAYIFPGLYIRHFFGLRGLLVRKLAIDCYVLIKLIFPAVVLVLGFQYECWVQMLVFYLGMETLCYVAGLLFLSDIYKAPISHKRSYLMFMINYIEMCLYFSVLYGGMRLVTNVSSSSDAVYFSFVTGLTVGYGDMLPVGLGKWLAVSHSLISLFFVTLVLAKAVASFEINHAKKVQ